MVTPKLHCVTVKVYQVCWTYDREKLDEKEGPLTKGLRYLRSITCDYSEQSGDFMEAYWYGGDVWTFDMWQQPSEP